MRLNIYVLINNTIDPDFQVVPDRNVDIAGQTVSTMLKAQIRSVIFRTYEFAQDNGLGFNLTYLDEEGPHCGIGFDTVCMRRLYEYGFEKARSGRFWQTKRPSPGPRVVAQRRPGGIMGRVVRIDARFGPAFEVAAARPAPLSGD